MPARRMLMVTLVVGVGLSSACARRDAGNVARAEALFKDSRGVGLTLSADRTTGHWVVRQVQLPCGGDSLPMPVVTRAPQSVSFRRTLSHQRGCHSTVIGTPARLPSVPEAISNRVRAFVASVRISNDVRTMRTGAF
jgi:hypothetical protein